MIYKTEKGKFNAVIEQIAECHERNQPVLVGTISIEKSEHLSKLLKQKGIPHVVLNAKYHEKEAEIVAQAGKFGAVTIATNMAGRGTDIKLGGNAEYLAKAEMRRLGFPEAVSYTHLDVYKRQQQILYRQGPDDLLPVVVGDDSGGVWFFEEMCIRDRCIHRPAHHGSSPADWSDISGGGPMRWPELVPETVCTTPITVNLDASGINEDGSPKAGQTIETMCNFQQKSKWSMDGERRLLQLQATALFRGDIAPELEVLVGTVTTKNGGSWVIHSSSRARNPDGTVNYTCLLYTSILAR